MSLTTRPSVERGLWGGCGEKPKSSHRHLKHLINFPPAGRCIFIKGGRQDAAKAADSLSRSCTTAALAGLGALQINARMSPRRLSHAQLVTPGRARKLKANR